jgi:hypothetical protein
MTEIGDESDDVRQLQDALELTPDEIDAVTRERHLARALDEFDASQAHATPATVVPIRRRRMAVVAAAAAVVLAVVGIGAVLASRGHDDTVATRAEAPSTTVAASAATPSPLGDASSSANAGAAMSIGDFPTVDALRAAVEADRAAFAPLAVTPSSAAAPANAKDHAQNAPASAQAACPTPPLGDAHVVDRVVASVAGAPVTVWIADDSTGARDVIVVDDATCTVRPR